MVLLLFISVYNEFLTFIHNSILMRETTAKGKLIVATTFLSLIFSAIISYQTFFSAKKVEPSLMASACGKNINCLANSLVDIIQRDGIDEGLSHLNTFTEVSQIQCHEISHAAGREMYKRVGKGVLSLNEYFCQGGFTHGWMADIGRSFPGEKSIDILSSYCKNSPAFTACQHGIGHALGENKVSSKEISRICVKSAGSSSSDHPVKTVAGSCVEGWVMGNRELFNKFTEKSIENALLYCSTLVDSLRLYCSGQVYIHWIDQGGDLQLERITFLSQYCNTFQDYEYALCTNYLGESIGTLPISNGNIKSAIKYTNLFCSIDILNNRCLDADLFALATLLGPNVSLSDQVCSKLKVDFFEKCEEYSILR
jgi:hypothetical protein